MNGNTLKAEYTNTFNHSVDSVAKFLKHDAGRTPRLEADLIELLTVMYESIEAEDWDTFTDAHGFLTFRLLKHIRNGA